MIPSWSVNLGHGTVSGLEVCFHWIQTPFYRWLLFIITEKHTLLTMVMWLPNWFDRIKMVSSRDSLGLTGMHTQVHREIPVKVMHFVVLMANASSTNPMYVGVWKDMCRITMTNGKGQTSIRGVYGGHHWIATTEMDL
jgi:hypothetical protein